MFLTACIPKHSVLTRLRRVQLHFTHLNISPGVQLDIGSFSATSTCTNLLSTCNISRVCTSVASKRIPLKLCEVYKLLANCPSRMTQVEMEPCAPPTSPRPAPHFPPAPWGLSPLPHFPLQWQGEEWAWAQCWGGLGPSWGEKLGCRGRGREQWAWANPAAVGGQEGIREKAHCSPPLVTAMSGRACFSTPASPILPHNPRLGPTPPLPAPLPHQSRPASATPPAKVSTFLSPPPPCQAWAHSHPSTWGPGPLPRSLPQQQGEGNSVCRPPSHLPAATAGPTTHLCRGWGHCPPLPLGVRTHSTL